MDKIWLEEKYSFLENFTNKEESRLVSKRSFISKIKQKISELEIITKNLNLNIKDELKVWNTENKIIKDKLWEEKLWGEKQWVEKQWEEKLWGEKQCEEKQCEEKQCEEKQCEEKQCEEKQCEGKTKNNDLFEDINKLQKSMKNYREIVNQETIDGFDLNNLDYILEQYKENINNIQSISTETEKQKIKFLNKFKRKNNELVHFLNNINKKINNIDELLAKNNIYTKQYLNKLKNKVSPVVKDVEKVLDGEESLINEQTEKSIEQIDCIF